ncbi:helix-turn-helix domain-containing protein [Streptomyces sp. C1-2]|nr:helix-turn-helix domain-containing protein [Streptomyces sp. C1-2]
MRRRDDDIENTEGRPDWLTWLTDVLTSKGYDLSPGRSGGKAQLARDTGLSQGIVTRLLSGEAVSYETLLSLSRGTGIPVADLLIRTGKATEGDFAHTELKIGQPDVVSERRLTPEEVAVAAGVPEEDWPWFTTLVRRMRRSDMGDGGSSAGGAAAEG